MRVIEIRVKAGAKHDRVTPTGERSFDVEVKAPARDGKANMAIIRLLARHLGVPQASIRIKMGATGRRKLIEVTSS